MTELARPDINLTDAEIADIRGGALYQSFRVALWDHNEAMRVRRAAEKLKRDAEKAEQKRARAIELENRPQCIGINKYGKQCHNRARPGEITCWFHRNYKPEAQA